MKRADRLNVEGSCLFKDVLHLNAVLADDIGIVSSRVIEEDLLKIIFIRENARVDRAKRSECIRTEERSVRLVICKHDLRPVDHRSKDEPECVRACLKRLLVLDDDSPDLCSLREEVREHLEGLCISDEREIRIHGGHRRDLRAVVRLHVQDHQIIEAPSVKDRAQIFEILIRDGDIGSVEDDRLLIEDRVAVVGYSVRKREKILKERQTSVASTDPEGICSDFLYIDHKNLHVFHFVYFIQYTSKSLSKKQKIPCNHSMPVPGLHAVAADK